MQIIIVMARIIRYTRKYRGRMDGEVPGRDFAEGGAYGME